MKHTITLNIGLVTNEGQPVNPDAVRARLAQLGFRCVSNDVQQSETEPTLVWRGFPEQLDAATEVLNKLRNISEDFSQDCIAFVINTQTCQLSALVGPSASKWGAFNPEHFLA